MNQKVIFSFVAGALCWVVLSSDFTKIVREILSGGAQPKKGKVTIRKKKAEPSVQGTPQKSVIRQDDTTIFGAVLKTTQFALKRDWTFTDPGGIGVCPNVILEAERTNRKLMESDPEAWHSFTFQSRLAESLALISDFVGVDSGNVCFAQTCGFAIDQVLHHSAISANEAILRVDLAENESITDIATCSSLCVQSFCKSIGADEVVVFANHNESEADLCSKLQRAILSNMKDSTHTPGATSSWRPTKIAICVIDHVYEPLGVVLPIESLIRVCHSFGVLVLVNGQMTFGQNKLNLDKLGADFYTGEFQPWGFGPRNSAFLYSRDGTSHMMSDPYMHDHTSPPAPCDVAAISTGLFFLNSLGGVASVRYYCSSLRDWAVNYLSEEWCTESISTPHTFSGLVRLPHTALDEDGGVSNLERSFLSNKIRVRFIPFNGSWWLRVSAAVFSEKADFIKLANTVSSISKPDFNFSSPGLQS